jgi:hypothetical protein
MNKLCKEIKKWTVFILGLDVNRNGLGRQRELFVFKYFITVIVVKLNEIGWFPSQRLTETTNLLFTIQACICGKICNKFKAESNK